MAKSSGDAAVDGKIIKILKEIAHIEPAIVANKSVASEESVSVPAGKASNLIEELPEFPGGTKALFKWIQDNLKFPVISRNNGSQGLAVIAFTVNKDGSVSDVRVAESTNDVYLDYEAMRIVKMMPKWSPGTIGGKPVEVSFKMPIRFRLQ